LPVYESNSEEEEDAAPLCLSPGDYIHEDHEEEGVIQQVVAVLEA
jgi:hypothetical protein